MERLDVTATRARPASAYGPGDVLDYRRVYGVVADVAATLQPHRLCTYLYDLAGTLSVFYERCPVLRSEGEVRSSRLTLCCAARRVLAAGLDLLGIEALDRM